MLNEKQWRQFLALEAQERGSILEVALDAGVSKNTVRRGREEIEGGDLYTPGTRQRNKGAGRKKKESQDETLITDLEGLNDHARNVLQSFEKLAKEAFGSFFVASALH